MSEFIGPIDPTSVYAPSELLSQQTGISASDLLADPTLFAAASSGFDPNANPTDPTNAGDTGGVQNISTPATAGTNNPETGGSSNWGTVLNNSLSAAFAAWNIASQPKGTPRTVTTRVGTTTVTSGGGLGSIFGSSSSGSNLLVIGVIVIGIVLLIKYAGR